MSLILNNFNRLLAALLLVIVCSTLHGEWVYLGTTTDTYDKSTTKWFVDSEVRKDKGVPNKKQSYRQVWIRQETTTVTGILKKKTTRTYDQYYAFSTSNNEYYDYTYPRWLGPMYANANTMLGKARAYVLRK
jgi:hypothetical protein